MNYFITMFWLKFLLLYFLLEQFYEKQKSLKQDDLLDTWRRFKRP